MCLPVHPFKVEREWEHAGLKCAVVQAREASFRCAYVRVPPGHPLHGKYYDDDAVDVNVHGGLTFAQIEPCTEEDGMGWWFGFDFCHCNDAMHDPDPDMATIREATKHMLATVNRIHCEVSIEVYGRILVNREHFWTQAEVEHECEDLAEQLAAMK